MAELGPFRDVDGYMEALELDERDPLRGERGRFRDADPELIYLDGNSLGMMPVDAPETAAGVVETQWGEGLIRSWNAGWWDLQIELGEVLAPVIGARPGEVVVSDSTSVNLFKLAVAALGARPGRSRILTDDLNFPTDLYVLSGIADLLGRDHRVDVIPSPDGIHGPVEAIEKALDHDVALVTLSATCFKSAYTYDIAQLTAAAHRVGALVLWDLSHTAGSYEVDVTQDDVDLAVGCTYKYLNGGPGAPAFLYVRRSLQSKLDNPITAWWGHADPFAMQLGFEPTAGVRRFHTGTMPIVSLATARPGIEHVAAVGMPAIRKKSVALTEYFMDQAAAHLAPLGFEFATPTDPMRRGSHVSLAHPAAWQVVQAMIAGAKVLPDFRAPNVARFGLSPLTTSFVDIHTAIQRVAAIVHSGEHLRFAADRRPVT